jgi:triphosphoribosyl-dephospho-CoA synthetase
MKKKEFKITKKRNKRIWKKNLGLGATSEASNRMEIMYSHSHLLFISFLNDDGGKEKRTKTKRSQVDALLTVMTQRHRLIVCVYE